jgi:anaerobic dimethyl sulfoxide reductase subunit B (iron-sulfur subunit)
MRLTALEFGPVEDLEKKYGNLRSLEDMPKGSLTRPAVVFKPADPKSDTIGM